MIVGVMLSLWFTHRKSRKENQIKLEQYYNEQIAFRQSIMSMSHAKNSLLSLPPNTVRLLLGMKIIAESQTSDQARRSVFAPNDDAYGFASGQDARIPNLRRDSSAAWSDAADSEVLLFEDGKNGGSSGSRYRG